MLSCARNWPHHLYAFLRRTLQPQRRPATRHFLPTPLFSPHRQPLPATSFFFNELHTPGGRGYPIMVNWVSDEDTHPERAQRVEGPLFASDMSPVLCASVANLRHYACHILNGYIPNQCRRADIFSPPDVATCRAPAELRSADGLLPAARKQKAVPTKEESAQAGMRVPQKRQQEEQPRGPRLIFLWQGQHPRATQSRKEERLQSRSKPRRIDERRFAMGDSSAV